MIVIVDYGVGNLGSILNMFRKIGAPALVSSEAADIERADKLVLPGVGAFDNGMRSLEATGLIPVLRDRVLGMGTPMLGICLGLQLLTKGSEEGTRPGLGWIEAETVRFRFGDGLDGLRIPHMGWNLVSVVRPSPLFETISQSPRFYFVHSYHLICGSDRLVVGLTRYGHEFPAAVAQGNILGTQFHPEKSHRFGMALLRNFVERL